MEAILFALFVGAGLQWLVRVEQRERIVLLSSHLGRFQIERDMAMLLEGYLPALTETQPERREQRLRVLADVEQRLVAQLREFEQAFGEVWGERARVSRLPLALPWATRLFPRASFDLRRAFSIHADGVAHAVENPDALDARERAFRITAELLLLQHSCHWFCRSRNVAHARLLAHHRTAHAQVLEAVSGATRQSYLSLVGR